MKASDKPEISKKWWVKEKPDDIKGKELEGALADCEKWLADAKKDENALQGAIASLARLSDAVKKTVSKECDKKKDKDLITVLEKYYDLIDDQTKDFEKAQSAQAKDGEEEESEEDKGVLKPEYLERMIKKLRGGEQLQFAFGLDKHTPTDSRLVLCNKRKPERLRKILKGTGDFSNRLLTFGTATGEGKLLQFNLSDDAKEPSQIAKLTKAYLKGHKELKYRKLRVIAGGQTFEEDMPEEGDGVGDLQQRLRKAEAAGLAWQKAQESVSEQIAQVQRELNAFDDPDALSVHDGLSSLIGKIQDPGFRTLALSSDAATFSSNLEKTRSGLAQLRSLIAQGGALQTVDGNPFAHTEIVDTVSSALDSIERELQIA